MSEFYENYPFVPEYLRRPTVETMPLDKPHYARTQYDERDDPEDKKAYPWVDQDSGALSINAEGQVDIIDTGDWVDVTTDLIPIMRVHLLGESNHAGIVADVRYLKPGAIEHASNRRASDDEDRWRIDDVQRVVQFNALAVSRNSEAKQPYLSSDEYEADKSNDELLGNPRYFDTLRYLMGQVDYHLQDGLSDPSEAAREPTYDTDVVDQPARAATSAKRNDYQRRDIIKKSQKE